MRIAKSIRPWGDPVPGGKHLAADLRAEGIIAIQQRRLDHGEGGVEQDPKPEQRKHEAFGGAQAGHASRL